MSSPNPAPKSNPNPPQQSQANQQQVQLAGVVVPRIPPREPQGNATWRVMVRHTPLLGAKSLAVQAEGKDGAWKAWLAAAEQHLAMNQGLYSQEPGQMQQVSQWLAMARAIPPDGIDIVGEEYFHARKAAMLVKGTVTVDQIGFPELASA